MSFLSVSAPSRRLVATIAALTVSLSLFGGLGRADAAALPDRVLQAAATGLPDTVGADALPTWQLNGVVWSQAIVGTTVYVTGSFTKARPPGKAKGDPSEVPAGNLFAFDLTTGDRVASFDHTLNAQGMVLRASPDGARLYLGGDFTTVDGIARQHVAAFNTADGSLVPDFAPYVGGQVRALAVSPTTVYVGGNFTAAGTNTALRSLAAFDKTGAQQGWAPIVGGQAPAVYTMVLTPDRSAVVVGGSFDSLDGTAYTGMGAVSTAGAVLPWAAQERVKTSGPRGGITALKTDGVSIFGSGQSYSDPAARFEGTFAANPSGGAIRWLNDCLGDSYDVAPMGGVLYSVHHAHDCRTIHEFGDTNPRSRWMKATAAPDQARGTITESNEYTWDFRGLPYAGLLQWYPDLAFGTATAAGQAAWSVEAGNGYVVLGGEFPQVNGVAQQCLTRFAVPAKGPGRSGPQITPVSTPRPAAVPTGVKVSWRAAWDRDDAVLSYELFRGTTKIATLSQESSFWYLPSMTFVDTSPGASPTYSVRISDPTGNTVTTATSPPASVTSQPDTAYATVVLRDGPTHYWPLNDPAGQVQTDDRVGGMTLTGSSVDLGAAPGLSGPAARAVTGSELTSEATDFETPEVTVEAWVNLAASGGGRVIGRGSDSSRDSLQRNDVVLYVDAEGRPAFATTPDKTKALTGIRSALALPLNSWHHLVATAGPQGQRLYVDGAQVASSPGPAALASFAGFWRVLDDSTVGLPNAPVNRTVMGLVDEVAVYAKVLDATAVSRHHAAGSGVGNLDPTAAFSAASAGLVATFDGTASRDADGTLTGYRWEFGDGSTGGGATSSHTYAAAGTYVVRLVVTDDRGSTAAIERELLVTVGAQAARDRFEREVTQGWGAAEVGGAWTTTGAATRWSVAGGVARFTGTPASGSPAVLPVSRSDNDIRVTVSSDKAPAGGAQFFSVIGRSASGADYRGKLRFGTDGVVTAFLGRSVNGLETTLASAPVPGLRAAADTAVNVRVHVVNLNPTVLRMKVWLAGTSEPAQWVLQTTDGFAPLQAPGSVAVTPYLSGATTNAPVTIRVDNLTVTGNTPPRVQQDVLVSGRTVTGSCGGTVDADGTVAGCDWSFGDGSSASGLSVSHTYAQVGTYPVSVTAVDELGARAGASQSVTVVNLAPVALFTPSASWLDVSFDARASADPDGSIASYSWAFGDGGVAHGATAQHTYPAAGTYPVTLTVTDNEGSSAQTTVSVTVVADQPSAQDSFTRSVVGGWGNADIGGPWSVTASRGAWSVNGNVGAATLPAGSGSTAMLPSQSRTHTELTVQVATSTAPTGGGLYVSVIGRSPAVGTDYRAKLRLSASGAVQAHLVRMTSGTETVLGWVTVPAVSYTVGDKLMVRLQVTGTAPTTMRLKVWEAGTTEPGSWTVSATDSTAAVQSAGAVGLHAYLSASATAPVTVQFDNVRVGSPRP